MADFKIGDEVRIVGGSSRKWRIDSFADGKARIVFRENLEYGMHWVKLKDIVLVDPEADAKQCWTPMLGDVVRLKTDGPERLPLIVRSVETQSHGDFALCVSECGKRISWADPGALELVNRPDPQADILRLAIAKAVADELRGSWANRLTEPAKRQTLADGLVGVWVPAKQAEAPWTPKVGDWVKVTKPVDCTPAHKIWWVKHMDEFDGQVMKVTSVNPQSPWANLDGLSWDFDFAWLALAADPRFKLAPLNTEWLQKMAELESGKCLSVGGLAVDLGLYKAPNAKHREPTRADLAKGPIECEYRDNDSEQWRSGFLVYILNGAMPFLCVNKQQKLNGQWNQCRIEVTE